MKNLVQELASTITLVAPYTRTAGQGAQVGSLFGVSVSDVSSGSSNEFMVHGVFDITKASGAVTQGQLIYWDDSAKNATTTSNTGANLLIGKATEAASSGNATARVRLSP